MLLADSVMFQAKHGTYHIHSAQPSYTIIYSEGSRYVF
jgi:hypothetical protein